MRVSGLGCGAVPAVGAVIAPLLVRSAIFLASAVIGLLVAKATLDGMSIDASSFIAVVLVFAVLHVATGSTGRSPALAI